MPREKRRLSDLSRYTEGEEQMSDKPEALRLADHLARYDPPGTVSPFAAELRRLHAECEALRADAGRYRWLEKVEPVAWAISYDGETPGSLWDAGDGALLDLEVKRQGGTTRKMALYAAAPSIPALTDAEMSVEFDRAHANCGLGDFVSCFDTCRWAYALAAERAGAKVE